ncbi:MAG: class I SAM-dependent methyltransferase [Gammaproteobacteria bacterium]|nr:class I SAM-dependent methyltransferase [Gammaproteobacteria bacterium]
MNDSLNNTMHKTRAMLARHHRDGESFVELMKETYDNRFDDTFWTAWQQWIEPVFAEQTTVLDLGCGPGLFIKELAGRYPGVHAMGVECAPYMLEAVGELPTGCEIIEEDLQNPRLPLDDNSVDAALAAVLLHEMHQPVKLLLELQRCLKPGGRIYIIDWVRGPLETYIHHESKTLKVFDPATSINELEDLFIHFIEHNRFSVDDLSYLLSCTGFNVLDSRTVRDDRYAHIVAEKGLEALMDRLVIPRRLSSIEKGE